MSHTNPTGNGCSLEDCLTNLFALTDLCGIKWRRYSSNPETVEPLEDPVLIGFSRCISLDILCVWRRVKRNDDQRQPDFNSGKELWIFWYGEEPESLRQAISPDLGLREQESGSWDRAKDNDSSLFYSTRTLLFKALHNLIERHLLMKRFVRLGSWYVLPYEHGTTETGVHLSFCFHYFLHGESQVCASIEVKLRPPVWRLTPQHLALVQDNQANIQVILAPHGLSGVLTGVTYWENEPTGTTAKMFQDWTGYYPLADSTHDSKLPTMVEVVVGTTRMRYPTCYVLVCDTEDLPHGAPMLPPFHHGVPNPHHRGPTDPILGNQAPTHPGLKPNIGSDSLPAVGEDKAEILGNQLAEKVRQDACVSLAVTKRLSEPPGQPGMEESPSSQSPSQPLVGTWNFIDPTTKVNCNCVKHRKKLTGKGVISGKDGKLDKRDKLERQFSRHSRNSVPFHRRGLQSNHLEDWQLDVEGMMSPSLPSLPPPSMGNPAFCPTGTTTINSNNPNNTHHARSSTPMPPDAVHPADTPNSAPSPLDEPQPPASSIPDPTMPTLSPHPPSKNPADNTNVRGSTIPPGSDVATNGTHGTQQMNGSNIANSLSLSSAPNPPGSNANINGCNTTSNLYNNSSSSIVPNSTNNVVGGLMTPLLGDAIKEEAGTPGGSVMGGVATCGSVPPGSTPHAGEAQFSWSSTTTKTESVSHWVHSHQLQRAQIQLATDRKSEANLKRPHLPTKGSDCDSQQQVDSLYDFNSLNAWINLPLKKCRLEPSSDSSFSSDLLSPGSSFPSHSRLAPLLPSPSPPEADPYEFSDEASKDPKTLTTRQRPSRDDILSGMSRSSPGGIKMEDDGRHIDGLNNLDGGLIVKEEPTNGETDVIASPLTPGGSLTRERDLRVKGIEDLVNIFPSDSSEDDDDGGALDSGLGSKSIDDQTKPSSRLPNGSLSAQAPLVDLARMYPTPPSHETNKSHSPETMTESMNEAILTGNPVVTYHNTVEVKAVPPVTDHISQVKCDVFIPPPFVEAVGSSKYSSVQLPSGQLSPVASYPDYKPSWNLSMPLMDVQQVNRTPYVNLPSVENISSIRTVGSGAGIDASPAFNMGSNQRTPMSYELTSPASNSSSYLNKTNNSIDNHGTNSQLPEANSLLLNVLLSDSNLNLYKDHNFDSCNICVCNMDINGSDVPVYLPDTSSSPASSKMDCKCAFSATINRRFGYDAGLFYEDEVEITGYRHERYEIRKPPLAQLKANSDSSARQEDISPQILQQLLDQYSSPFLSCISSHHLRQLQSLADTSYQPTTIDLLQINHGNDVVNQALEVAMDHFSRYEEHSPKGSLHKWPYLRGASCVPSNSQDIIQCLKSLHPILQDAIQSKRVTRSWETQYRLQGPISWRDFHEMAGRGAEENHEPQPIPQLLVGHDRDNLHVSPYSLRYWDKLFLEPYSRMRDVLYVVVCPDNDVVLKHTTVFFKELSTVYEMCRLGRHCAINKPLRDGVLRVGKSAAQKLVDEPVDDWFSSLGDSQLASKLKLYAQVCKHNLAPILCDPNFDKGMFEQGSSNTHKAQFKMPEPASLGAGRPPTPDGQMMAGQGQPGAPHAGTQEADGKDPNETSGQPQRDPPLQQETPESNEVSSSQPGIVIYIVDPFSYGTEPDSISRLAMIGLLKCYQQMALPEHLANNLCLQLIPLSTIMEHREASSKTQLLKSVAFSTFTSSMWSLGYSIMGRPLTGFGPAAAAEIILRRRAGEEHRKLYSPPFILSTTKSSHNQIMETTKADHVTVLFCGYCLSEDQRWLIAVCTDDKGELMEHTTINIDIPNRNRRKKASARRPGLQKLWDFLLGLVSLTSYPTRLVIGRFGRMGHGELKGWSALLRQEKLQEASKKLKEMCTSCSAMMGPSDVPCIVSACLVSLETHPSFQIVMDTLKQEEKQSSSIPLQTPRDASVTHILVFPTSATAQVNSTNPLQQANPGEDPLEHEGLFGDDDIGDLEGLIGGDTGGNSTGPELGDLNWADLFNVDSGGVFGAPTVDQPVSPTSNRLSSKTNGGPSPMWERETVQNQQPLAMGYYISTAPPGTLPKWFWSAAPENEFSNPHVFKSSLHINETSKHDDILPKSDKKPQHPLDGPMTSDVLRYVLENYNALSWLTFDPVLNDRRSCLPVHFVVLMQLYHALHAFV